MNVQQKKRLRLLTPGPVELQDEIIKEMGRPIKPDYGYEWTLYFNQTRKLLGCVFGTTNDIIILVGSGSSGIEACIGSALCQGQKILVGINGFFGERIKEIAENLGINVITIEQPWGKPLAPQAFEDVLKYDKSIKLIAVVHLETSTTIINPIKEIGQISKKYNVPLLVDAVSSLGGIPFYMDDWGIDFCVSASQKCLGAPPGLAPLAVSQRGWELIRQDTRKYHGWYLNLNVWNQYEQLWTDWHPYPITMAVTTLFALNRSLEILLKDGVENRSLYYQSLAMKLRLGLRQIGFSLYTPDEIYSPLITAVLSPQNIASSKIIKYLIDNHSVQIAGGLGIQKDKIFRIGHMAPTITLSDIEYLIYALAKWSSR